MLILSGECSLIADYRAEHPTQTGVPIAALEHYAHYYPFGMQQPGRNGNRYRFGFNGMEMDDEVNCNGNSYDFGARLYSPRIGRWMAMDPLAYKYPGYSPYNFGLNNPIYFIDQDGKEPREGNEVQHVDFTRCFIILIRDDSERFGKTDKHLRRSAGDRFAHVTFIGPRGRGPKVQQKFFEYKGYSDMFSEDAFLESKSAYAWIVASKSDPGYKYVEFKEKGDKLQIINRDVVNYNEKLGVDEGFENLVRRKDTYEQDKEGDRQLVSVEFWQYRTVETEEGEKKVEFKHIKIYSEPGVENEVSDWQEAEPSKYDPDED
ncbi:MAG: RHS repeat domain-containing protein [Bacteroidota bacterium]